MPGTKADNHLFWGEGCNLGPAGGLAPVPLGRGVLGSCVTWGQAASVKQLPTKETTLSPCFPIYICLPRFRPETSHSDKRESNFSASITRHACHHHLELPSLPGVLRELPNYTSVLLACFSVEESCTAFIRILKGFLVEKMVKNQLKILKGKSSSLES